MKLRREVIQKKKFFEHRVLRACLHLRFKKEEEPIKAKPEAVKEVGKNQEHRR